MQISFDSRLYSRKAVDLAIEDFKEHATFRVEDRNGRIVVQAEGIDDKLDDVFEDEFFNYVLAKVSL